MAKNETITQEATVLGKTVSGTFIIVSLQAGEGAVHTFHLTAEQAKGLELGDTVVLTLVKK